MTAPAATPFPFSLARVFFTKSVVIAIPEHQPNPEGVVAPPENHVHLEKAPDQERTYAVTARTVVNAARSVSDPYHIEMECVAILIADETLPEAEAARGAMITGHTVTMGAIREAISWITGRQPYGSLMLGLSVLKPPAAGSQPAKQVADPEGVNAQKGAGD